GRARLSARARIPRRPLIRRPPVLDPRGGPARARRRPPPALLSPAPARPRRGTPDRALPRPQDAGALRPRLGGSVRRARRARVGPRAHPPTDGAAADRQSRPRSAALLAAA